MAATRSITSNANGTTFAANTTQYAQIGGSLATRSTTEAIQQTTYRSAGVLSNLFVYVMTNTLTLAGTVSSRLNTAAGSQTLSVTAATTGVFEDTTNTDTIAAADKINYQTVTVVGGTSMILTEIGSTFTATTNTVKKFVCTNQSTVTSSGATIFAPLQGSTLATATQEVNIRYKAGIAGTLANMFAHISTNSRTSITTLRVRKNGASGNLVISVATTTTGFFEDTTHTDTFVVTDFLNYAVVMGATAQSLVIDSLGVEFTTTTDSYVMLAGASSVNTVPASTAGWMPIDGLSVYQAVAEVRAQSIPRTAFTAANLSIYIVANAGATNGTVVLRQNGSNTILTTSITALTTGLYEDLSNTVSIAATDLINYQFTGGGTGATTFAVVGMTAAVSAGVTATPGTASLVLTSFVPTVTGVAPASVTPNTAALTLTTFAPVVTATSNQSVIPGTAALTTTSFVPTVTVSSNQAVIPPTLALTTTLFAPTVTVSANQSVVPGTASLTTSTFAPTVSVSTGVVVQPGTATLTLTTFAPAGGATGVTAYPSMIFDIDGNALKRVTEKLYMKI